jgi:hypothetical protein
VKDVLLLRDEPDSTRVVSVISEVVGGDPEDMAEDPMADIALYATWDLDPVSLLYQHITRPDAMRVVAKGPSDDVRRVTEALRSRLATVPTSEVVDEARSAGEPGRRADAIARLSLAVPPDPDQHILDLITEALSADDPDVRLAALRFVAASGWSEFDDMMLTRIADSDPDPAVRADALNELDRRAIWREYQ